MRICKKSLEDLEKQKDWGATEKAGTAQFRKFRKWSIQNFCKPPGQEESLPLLSHGCPSREFFQIGKRNTPLLRFRLRRYDATPRIATLFLKWKIYSARN